VVGYVVTGAAAA